MASEDDDGPLVGRAGTLAAIGEISLAGEVRPVSQAKQRDAEAKRLGFTSVVDDSSPHLREAMRVAFATAQLDQSDVPTF